MCGGGRGWGVDPKLFILNISFSWVKMRLYIESQLPVLFRSAVVSINPILAGGRGGVGAIFFFIFLLVGLK